MTTWTVAVAWKPIWSDEHPVVEIEKPTWAEARRYALKAACLAGVRRIDVTDPVGRLAATYDRSDNVFRRTEIGRAADVPPLFDLTEETR